jgi:hypothetical protein
MAATENNTGDMLAKAVDSIAALAKKAAGGLQVHNVDPRNQHSLVFDSVKGEVFTVEPLPLRPTVEVLSIADLKTWASSHVDRDNASSQVPGDIVISGTRASKGIWPRCDRPTDFASATKPFFDRFLPPKTANITTWSRWFDTIASSAGEGAVSAVNAALSRVTAGGSKEVTVERNDAVAITIASDVKGVKTAAPFPKRLVAQIPYGDPDFRTNVCFVFALETDRGEVVVHSSVDELWAGADIRQEYVKWAKEQLADLTAAGWAIMGAP